MSNQLTAGDLNNNITAMAQSFDDAIPKSMRDELDSSRFIRIALTSIKSNPMLLACKPDTIYKSLVEACQLGLTVDGVLGHAYLVPYKGVCTLIVGYKGLKTLVNNTGKVAIFKTGCVYKGDTFVHSSIPFDFQHTYGDSDRTDDNDITHVYTWWKLSNGECDALVWTAAKARKHQVKHGGKSPAWKSSFPKMAEKSTCRDAIGSGAMPTSSDVQTLVLQSDEYDRDTTVSTITSSVISEKPTNLKQLENKFVPTVGETQDDSILDKAVNAVKACETVEDVLAVQKEFEPRLSTDDSFELNQVCEEHAATLQTQGN